MCVRGRLEPAQVNLCAPPLKLDQRTPMSSQLILQLLSGCVCVSARPTSSLLCSSGRPANISVRRRLERLLESLERSLSLGKRRSVADDDEWRRFEANICMRKQAVAQFCAGNFCCNSRAPLLKYLSLSHFLAARVSLYFYFQVLYGKVTTRRCAPLCTQKSAPLRATHKRAACK